MAPWGGELCGRTIRWAFVAAQVRTGHSAPGLGPSPAPWDAAVEAPGSAVTKFLQNPNSTLSSKAQRGAGAVLGCFNSCVFPAGWDRAGSPSPGQLEWLRRVLPRPAVAPPLLYLRRDSRRSPALALQQPAGCLSEASLESGHVPDKQPQPVIPSAELEQPARALGLLLLETPSSAAGTSDLPG